MTRLKKIIIFSFFILLFSSMSSCTKNDLTKLKEWDMVFISTSNGWKVADIYAKMIEEDMGVKVNVTDLAIGQLSARSVLDGFEGKSFRAQFANLNELISEAEIIVVFVDPSESGFNDENWDKCFLGLTFNSDGNCPESSLGNYEADLRQIYDTIFTLKKGKPVIVHALGLYNPLISVWREKGIVDYCDSCWTMFNNTVKRISADYDIQFADVMSEFNGNDHSEDPRQKGYILDDGQHCTDLGAQVQAEVIRKLGYEPIVR